MTEYPTSDKKLRLPPQLNCSNNNHNTSNRHYHKIKTNNNNNNNNNNGSNNDEESVNYNNVSGSQQLTTSPNTTYGGHLCHYGKYFPSSLQTKTGKISKTPGSGLFNNCKQEFHYFNENRKEVLPSEKSFLLYNERNLENNNYYNDDEEYKVFDDYNADSIYDDDDRSTRATTENISNEELSDEYLGKNVEIILRNLQLNVSQQSTNRRNNQQRANLRNSIRKSLLNYYNNSNNINSICTNNFYNNSKNNKETMANIMSSPESDYNSNPPHYPCGGTGGEFNLNGIPNSALGSFVGGLNTLSGMNTVGLTTGGHLNCSIASSHDFTHDNSDYQWFLDYGYRDGGVTHQSILSSLSASYNGIGELSYYEDLAKNIDANLAEVDMDSFRAEDIHSLLTHLPSFCNKDNVHRSNTIRQNEQQIDDLQASDTMDNSICKSKLLFSPVKESHISVDSLDLDAYPEDSDIILTCQANKDNYTIAFEESAVYSDESYYAEPSDPTIKSRPNYINLHSNLDDIVKRKSLEVSMSRSDHSFTTWSKLKKSSTSQLQRYPSGNNNTSENMITRHAPHCIVRKSSSLPNLRVKRDNSRLLNVSQAISNSTAESYKTRNLLPMCHIPISNSGSDSPVHMGNNNNNSSNMHSTESAATTSSSNKQTHCNQYQNNQQPAFNLVKLFIKQKSSSSDTCMDVSSGCWPSDSSSSLEQNQQQQQRLSKKSMNDSGKGSALSRHEEVEIHTLDNETDKTTNTQCRIVNDNYSDGDGNNIRDDDDVNTSSYQLDSLDICENKDKHFSSLDKDIISQKNTINSENLYRDVFESHPKRREFLKESDINTNKPQQHYHNPQIYHLRVQNNNNFNNMNTNYNFNKKNNVINNNKSFEDELLVSDGNMNKSASDTENTFTNTGTSRTSENLTQILNASKSKQTNTIPITISCPRNNTLRRNNIKVSPVAEMITRSMQTSLLLRDRLRFVPPSFLANLNKLGGDQRAPVYVIYPNYTLPDLGFVNNNASSDIILSPFNYRNTVLHGGPARPSLTEQTLKNLEGEGENILRNIKYTQVSDWKSLVTLLPIECRKKLKQIPEADTELDPACSQRPLFCMTPPIRRSLKSNLCDCAKYFQQQSNYDLYQDHNQQQQTGCSSSSGSSQPPSSGYRGSSTLLTESEINAMQQQQQYPSRENMDPMRNMYVYKYDNNRMENDHIIPDDRLPPLTGGTGRTPKGILRRTSSRNSSDTGRNIKRNSMFENENNTESNVKNLEKRRSLQELHNDINYNANEYDENFLNFEENKLRQYYENLGNRNTNIKDRCFEQFNNNKMSDEITVEQVNLIEKKIRKEQDLEARLRAETFLSNVPKSELKYYAEIANILESTEADLVQYDAMKLKNEVSRALSQKKVSFNQPSMGGNINTETGYLAAVNGGGLQQQQQQLKKFSTPPNSPNISVTALRLQNNTNLNQHHHHHHHHHHNTAVHNNLNNPRLKEKRDLLAAEKERLEKISSNRFKRLQIQWELLSKDSSVMLKDLAKEKETKSGGSTPTSASAQQRSRIPRPVSYPTSNTTATAMEAKTVRSPSRIIPPKKYTSPTSTGTVCPVGGNTVNIGVAVQNQSPTSGRTRAVGKTNTTHKKRVPALRSNITTRAQ